MRGRASPSAKPLKAHNKQIPKVRPPLVERAQATVFVILELDRMQFTGHPVRFSASDVTAITSAARICDVSFTIQRRSWARMGLEEFHRNLISGPKNRSMGLILSTVFADISTCHR